MVRRQEKDPYLARIKRRFDRIETRFDAIDAKLDALMQFLQETLGHLPNAGKATGADPESRRSL